MTTVDTPETITEQQRYHYKEKEEKSKKYYQDNKKRLKKINLDRFRGLSQKEKK